LSGLNADLYKSFSNRLALYLMMQNTLHEEITTGGV